MLYGGSGVTGWGVGLLEPATKRERENDASAYFTQALHGTSLPPPLPAAYSAHEHITYEHPLRCVDPVTLILPVIFEAAG